MTPRPCLDREIQRTGRSAPESPDARLTIRQAVSSDDYQLGCQAPVRISRWTAGHAGGVDLGAVRAAPKPQLVACAIAAARNAQGLLHDAEVLADAGCTARAYSLAALAVEECGKAAGLTALAVIPEC